MVAASRYVVIPAETAMVYDHLSRAVGQRIVGWAVYDTERDEVVSERFDTQGDAWAEARRRVAQIQADSR